MTREQLQTAADVIRTMQSTSEPNSGVVVDCERLLNMFMYRWSITGKVIEQGEVYKAPNPQMAWYKSGL